MIDLDAVALQRAEEQVRAIVGPLPKHDPDTWDVRPQPKPPRLKPTRCHFLGCERKPHHRGWCHAHWMRLRRGTPLEDV